VRGGFTSTRFVLVEPSHPGNVGAAARALKTMGFSRLVLVAPRVPHVQSDPEAIAMASGADDVLAGAHVVPTLADALNGVQWSVALTARSREYGPPQLAPRAAAAQAREHACTAISRSCSAMSAPGCRTKTSSAAVRSRIFRPIRLIARSIWRRPCRCWRMSCALRISVRAVQVVRPVWVAFLALLRVSAVVPH
jgi:hypothetical protein